MGGEAGEDRSRHMNTEASGLGCGSSRRHDSQSGTKCPAAAAGRARRMQHPTLVVGAENIGDTTAVCVHTCAHHLGGRGDIGEERVGKAGADALAAAPQSHCASPNDVLTKLDNTNVVVSCCRIFSVVWVLWRNKKIIRFRPSISLCTTTLN